MPVIGWLAGSGMADYIRNIDHWVAFGLLGFIGGKMIFESFSRKNELRSLTDPTRRWSLVMLSIATSIDALAVGLSLALINVGIISASVIIGVVAAGMTLVGLFSGRKLGEKFGKRMEFVGGLILIAIGTKILIDHLTA